MNKIVERLAWKFASGRRSQSFLGARWVTLFLDRVSESKKRLWALRILSLSPHYFFDGDNPAFQGMSRADYLETAFKINSDSRTEIYEKMLANRLAPDMVVLDYGCGPGFLAKAVAPNVKKLYAVDISTGALACAKILNAEDHVSYIAIEDRWQEQIADESIDLAYSFAVFQHLTDEELDAVLSVCKEKVKRDGQIIAHVQIQDEIWRTEEEWKRDRSAKGRLKLRYGLHCFGRTEDNYRKIFTRHGFEVTETRTIEEIFGPVEDKSPQMVFFAKRRFE